MAGLFLAIPMTALLMVSHRHLLLHLGNESLLAGQVNGAPSAESSTLVASKTPSRPGLELSKISVLVVDDEEDAREVLVMLLEEREATVWHAGTAAEAVSMLSEHRPQVLVTDLAMPGADGFDLIRSVRALPPDGGGNTPALALSGYSATEDRDRTLAAGFQAHLSKPVRPAELISTIVRLAQGQ